MVRLRAGRLALLLLVLLAVLAVGGFWVLSTYGKKVVTAPVESLIQPSWIKEAVAYAPERHGRDEGRPSPTAAPRLMRQLTALQQEMQTQREALEALKRTSRPSPPPGPKAAPPRRPRRRRTGRCCICQSRPEGGDGRTQGE